MKYSLTLFFVFISLSLLAQQSETKITNVTVYRHGALINRAGTIEIAKGTHTYNVGGLSSDIDVNSIQVSIKDERAIVLSVNHHYSKVVNSNLVKEIDKTKNRREALKDSIRVMKSRRLVLLNERNLVLANNNVGTSNGTTVEALSQMAKFYNSELGKILNSLLEVEKKTKSFEEELNNLVSEAKEKSKKVTSMDSGIDIVVESAEDIKNTKIEMSYLVYSASWEPAYDVRIKDTNKPLCLDYLGKVRQNSAEEWKNVKLTLSTGDPSLDNEKPAFQSMHLPNSFRASATSNWKKPGQTFFYGRVTDQDGNAIEGAKVSESYGNHTETASDGTFAITMKGENETLHISHSGYKIESMRPYDNMCIVLTENQTEEELALQSEIDRTEADVAAVYEEQEVVVKEYGVQRKSRLTGSVVSVAAEKVNQSLSATEFVVKDAYTIPANNENITVNMLGYEIDAECYYSAMPRVSQEVYLQAMIPDCYQYSLLEGDANLYLNNVYQGKTHINPDEVQDTLHLSVARDNSIAISRREVSSNSKSGLGSNVRITKEYEIIVKNNKETAVKVKVEDQYPLSKYSDIKISLTENGGAKADAETGKLSWELDLAPQEQRKIRYGYEIKCPKSSYNIVTK